MEIIETPVPSGWTKEAWEDAYCVTLDDNSIKTRFVAFVQCLPEDLTAEERKSKIDKFIEENNMIIPKSVCCKD